MNERAVLIITNKGDQTREIDSYSINGNSVEIKFENSTKSYYYSSSKVTIKKEPFELDIHNKYIFYGEIPIRNVHEIFDFEGTFKVFFIDGTTQIYDSQFIRIEQLGDISNQAVSLLDYWSDIARYTNIEDEEKSFLKKEFDKLNSVHPESVLAVYMNKSPIAKSELLQKQAIFPFRFNLSQKEALELAMTSQLSIIEGPPGTGKTQTILNILANVAIMQNKTVAVVSGNNAAVQNVKDKLDKNGYDFIAASLGRREKRVSFFSNLPRGDVENWKSELQENEILDTLSRLTGQLNRLLELSNRKARIDQQLEAFSLEQKHFQLHNETKDMDSMGRLFWRRQTSETVISFLVDEYFAGKYANRLLPKAKLLLKYGFFDFKKLKHNRIELITSMQMKYYESKILDLNREKEQIQLELEQESFQDLLDQHEKYSTILFKHKLYLKYASKAPYKGNVKNYKENFKEFITHYPILLSTTHSLRSCIPEDFLFDYVIIDESSQVDLLTAVLAMSCCKRMIIVGDTKQLPQIVDKKIRRKLNFADVEREYDYFNHSLLSSVLEAYGENAPKVMLKEHYRCHPQIIGFCNNQYYNDELIPFTSVEASDIPIKLHYTSKGNHMRTVTVKGLEGTFNHREIDVVQEEILKELQLDHISNEDVGFTTPYRLQVKEADIILDQGVEIDTVHKYQGREKPVMILSTVLDQTSGERSQKFVEDSRLVNVAVSRAQKQLILVTDHSFFRNSRKDIGNLIRYIEYTTLHEHITQSELISVFDLLYTEYSEKLTDLESRLIIISPYKSESVIWTVLTDLMKEDAYKCFFINRQIHLKHLLKDMNRLNEVERKFVANGSSVDFVVYDALNKQPLLIIEVDGFESHRNNKAQIERDKKKNSILQKYDVPLLRLPTTGSNEIVKIRRKLDEMLSNSN
ncbi:AAA domain-containing protein [Paenibacillus sp. SC116]|uniref:AAA domain-containing protein n=1 Tax=Paenibacillus sp. SC116 TaxID=2968986 RepID=UPI00215AA0AD|nr:AAA domain-containing protein [Paenibacillus sp. SC116]MCR8843540.1 AAA domain-containing protein [Paenibacillus sp. SC116]